jgi:hypothetical protein
MLCIRILCVDRMCECACLSASRWHAQFLGGVAAKRWGCRAVLSLGVLGSGLACMLTPLAASHSWTAAFAMRVTAGVVFPCTCKGPLVMHRIIVVVVCVCVWGGGCGVELALGRYLDGSLALLGDSHRMRWRVWPRV